MLWFFMIAMALAQVATEPAPETSDLPSPQEPIVQSGSATDAPAPQGSKPESAEPARSPDDGPLAEPEPESTASEGPDGQAVDPTTTEPGETPRPSAPSEAPTDDPEQANTGSDPLLDSVEVVAPGNLTPGDIEVWVSQDGNLYLDGELVLASDLDAALELVRSTKESPRLVISSDEDAPHGQILAVVRAGTDAGIDRLALVVTGVGAGAAVPNGANTTGLQPGMTKAELRKMRPKRWKLPQNPYAQTDFTAYTLETRETKIGLTNLTHGLIPRVQVGTVPTLDIAGVWNMSAKANLVREGRFDAALMGQVYLVSVNKMIERWDKNNDFGLFGTDADGNKSFTSKISVVALGTQSSMQITRPWSIHAGASYLRVQIGGALDVQNLPEVLLPGLDPVGGDFALVPKVIGELLQLRFATDYRFNRRDSVILQGIAPVLVRARAQASASLAGLPDQLKNVDLIVAYGRAIPIDRSYRVALSYQLSWRHIDLRLGVGLSPVPFVWGLNAFDFSYRFGGKTRSHERALRQEFRAQKKEFREEENAEADAMAPDSSTPESEAAPETAAESDAGPSDGPETEPSDPTPSEPQTAEPEAPEADAPETDSEETPPADSETPDSTDEL